NMGDMSQMISMIPGLAGKLNGKNVDIDESKIAKSKAIIQSMTVKERRNPEIIKSSQKKRIAMGSGTNVQDVNALLKQFAQTQDMMQKMANMGKRGMRGMKLPF
ncbi:MAG: signal recognition particle protein, partial [Clostridia bacterium]|nr:signal recognition particle protein [Clostridia bacterium]